jgi:hypothetical protein
MPLTVDIDDGGAHLAGVGDGTLGVGTSDTDVRARACEQQSTVTTADAHAVCTHTHAPGVIADVVSFLFRSRVADEWKLGYLNMSAEKYPQ